MKAPSFVLLFYSVILLGCSVYLIVQLPSYAPQYKIATIALLVVMFIEAVFLIVRFRWSPEIYAALFFGILVLGVVQGVMDNFSSSHISMIVGSVVAMFGYPVLREEIRGQAVSGT